MKNNPESHQKLHWKAMIVLLQLFFFSFHSLSQESVYLRIPFLVEENTVLSGLVLETQSQVLNESFMQLQGRPKDRSELAYFNLLDAFRKGNVENISQYFYREPFSDPTRGSQIGKAFVDAFSNGIENANTVRSYHVGGETWYSLQIALGGRPARRVFGIVDENAPTGSNFWRFSQPTGDGALLNVVAQAEQLEMQGQEIFVDASFVEELQHEKTLVNGNTKWHFNGFTAKFDAFEQNAKIPENEVAIFYHQAMNALKTGFPEAIAGFYTSKSSDKYSNWVAEQGPQAYGAYVDDMIQQERKVEFILDANPIYLVFYKTSDGRMPYDIVFKNSSGDLKLTNFYMEGLMDDILKDRDYFVSYVIEPLVANTTNTAETQEMSPSNEVDSAPPSSPIGPVANQTNSIPTDTLSQTNQISKIEKNNKSADERPQWLLTAVSIAIFFLIVLVIKNKKS